MSKGKNNALMKFNPYVKPRREIWLKRLGILIILCLIVLFILITLNYGVGQHINDIFGLRGDSPASRHDPKAAVKKSEMVYVDTSTSGRPNSVVVDAKLKNNPEKKKIVDKTTLTGLYNINGNEKYSRNKDGTVTWPTAKGQDIFYEGTAKVKDLPVDISVKYYLNGKKIGGRALEGRSGRVRIVISYKNNVTEKVKSRKTLVPFVCLSAMLVTDKSFNKITVSPGKVIRQGKNKMVLGMASPGLSKGLKTGIMKKGIGDQVVISGIADKFAGQEIATLVSSDILKVVSNSKLDKLNADKKINLLDVSTKKLVWGTGKVADGVTLLHARLPQLTGGIDKAARGSVKLNTALVKAFKMMKAGAVLLKSATGALDTITRFEGTMLSHLKNDDQTGYYDRISNASKTTSAYITYMHIIFDIDKYGTPESAAAAIKKEFGIDISAESIRKIRDTSEASSLDPEEFKQLKISGDTKASDNNTYDSGKANALGAEEYLTKNITLSGIIIQAAVYLHSGTRVTDADGEIDGARTEELTDIVDTFLFDNSDTIDIGSSDLKKLKKLKTSGTDANGTKVRYYMGLDDLVTLTDKGTGRLLSGISRASASRNSLTSGTKALAEGMRRISKGTITLSSGVGRLNKGTNTLDKGMNMYYKKGIKKVVDMYNRNLKGVSGDLKQLKAAGRQYDNYSGLAKNMDGSVTFMYFTPMGDY